MTRGFCIGHAAKACFSRRFHAERLLRTPVIIELDLVGDDPHGVLLGRGAMTMYTWFLQGPDDALDPAVLLRTVRRDELLFQPIDSDQVAVMPAGEHQAIVGSQQERLRHSSQRAIARDQGLLQRRGSRGGLAAPGELPAEQFPAISIDHQCQRQPAVPAAQEPAKMCSPGLVWGHRRRGQCLDARPVADRSLADLPAPQLETPLHSVLVHSQRARHGLIAKRRLLPDQCLDRIGQLPPHIRGCLGGPVVYRPARQREPAAPLAHRDRKSIGL